MSSNLINEKITFKDMVLEIDFTSVSGHEEDYLIGALLKIRGEKLMRESINYIRREK